MKSKKTTTSADKGMPYINLNSPQIKEQLEKMGEILKNIKRPILSK
ncbi:hypothetical protein [Runella sp.]